MGQQFGVGGDWQRISFTIKNPKSTKDPSGAQSGLNGRSDDGWEERRPTGIFEVIKGSDRVIGDRIESEGSYAYLIWIVMRSRKVLAPFVLPNARGFTFIGFTHLLCVPASHRVPTHSRHSTSPLFFWAPAKRPSNVGNDHRQNEIGAPPSPMDGRSGSAHCGCQVEISFPLCIRILHRLWDSSQRLRRSTEFPFTSKNPESMDDPSRAQSGLDGHPEDEWEERSPAGISEVVKGSFLCLR
ncbi:hypothetical protein EV360DRAFT_82610 [Lentinula raphanica]|nr:hypothetical protein EV360DRAFT_82610 [Lentinula raphanica]